MNEREIAVMEGEMIHHEDAFFDARPQVDTGHNRHIFREGFERAWKGKHEPSSRDLLRQWADDFTEAAKHMPTRLQSVVLLTRAEEVLALLGEGNG